MFTTISWSNYLITVGVLLFCWYLFLIVKFYAVELKELFTGERKLNFPSRKNSSVTSSGFNISEGGLLKNSQNTAIPYLHSVAMEDLNELSLRLSLAIEESAVENLGSVEFQNYLRFILSEYSFVKISALRENINKLIVSECVKHPQLILTYEQVDRLWEETI
ncbi:hypothetical protein AB9T89_14315 [Flavobacterium oncorhynchi]|uniref:hypothetical protein n=1 Tax=Flavobacterium oncorhynchi TaxID=728056 RepID=UPI003519EF26